MSNLHTNIIINIPIYFRVLMECTYRGNFHEKHNNKKRRMVGPAKEKVAKLLCDDGISSQSYRELEANRIVKVGRYLLQKCSNYKCFINILPI